ncbi:MAG: ribonuclease HII, partial [Allomuricauda sp.]
MKIKLLFVFAALSLLSCKEEKQTHDTRLDYLPPSPALVVKIVNLTNFKSELKNNAILNNLKGFSSLEGLVDKLDNLGSVATDRTSILALYEVGKDRYDFIVVLSNAPDAFNVESITNKTVETLLYEGANITKYTLDDNEIFSVSIGKEMVLSSSQLLIENVARNKRNNPVDPMLKRLFEASSMEKSASLYLNMENNPTLLSLKEETTDDKNPFAEWISLDFTANSDAVQLNGIAMASDSTNNFINLFKGTSPLANRVTEFAPLNAQAVLSYTFDDYQTFAQNQNTYLDRVQKMDSLFNTIEEVGIIYLNNQKAVLLKSYGTEGLFEFLENNLTGSETYQGSEILELGNNNFVTEGFTPLVQEFDSNFCTVIENSFIFSEDKETLQTILSNYKSSSSFNN